MSSGERPIGAAKGKQSDTEALCQPPPLSAPPHTYRQPPHLHPQVAKSAQVITVFTSSHYCGGDNGSAALYVADGKLRFISHMPAMKPMEMSPVRRGVLHRLALRAESFQVLPSFCGVTAPPTALDGLIPSCHTGVTLSLKESGSMHRLMRQPLSVFVEEPWVAG